MSVWLSFCCWTLLFQLTSLFSSLEGMPQCEFEGCSASAEQSSPTMNLRR